MSSFNQYQEIGRKIKEEEKKRHTELERIRNEELKKRGVNPDMQECEKPKYDHPCTPEDGVVIVLYIIAMAASLLFKDFWIAWIALTVAFGKFITRHDND